MLLDLARALPAAVAAVVLPGYFWAGFVRPTQGLGERLTYSSALSAALVPVVALVLARATGGGVTLWIAIASVLLVLASGAIAVRLKGPARSSAGPVLPRPQVIRDGRVLALIATGLLIAVATMADHALPGWTLALAAVVLLAAGALAAREAGARAGQSSAGAGRGAAADIGQSIAGPGQGSAVGAGAPGGAGPRPAGASQAGADQSGASPAGRGPAGEPTGAGAVDAPPGAGPLAAVGLGGATATSTRPAAAVPPPRQHSESGGLRPGARPGRHSAADGSQLATLPARLRAPALLIVLGLTAFRAYVGAVRHDWPFLRGGDLFSHAVMAEQIMAHGQYHSYLIYPPGFSTLTAVISRLSGLAPLTLFPVLAPCLLILTTLAAYALGARLWGWEYGVVAAALSGLVLNAAYNGFAGGRYPDLIDAYFLVPMAVVALISFYESPSARSGLLLTAVGAAVVFYHSVASLYLAVLLALSGGVALVYLLRKRRSRDVRALLLAGVAMGVVAACYGLYTYGLPKFLGGSSATATAVSIALGSQPTPAPVHLLAELGPAIVWAGALGVAMFVMSTRRLKTPAQVLVAATLLLWCAMMYLGSRTAADGFPQRFERDLGAPLSVIGALALGVILLSVLNWQSRQRNSAWLAGVAVVAAVMVGMQTLTNVKASAGPGSGVLTRPVAAAGAWLAAHNTGGTIISTPYMSPGVSNRAVLAMGGYTGLQSYEAFRIAHPRSLPTAGKQPLYDSRNVLANPDSCLAASILARDDVRYVVLYKGNAPKGATVVDLAGFQSDPARYRLVFDNSKVAIYQPSHAPCSV